MREYTITRLEKGQRFDKYLAKRLKEAPSSFIYKMLRKKNITLNGKKAEGKEILNEGDQVKFFLSDETFEKFAGEEQISYPTCRLEILYEDGDTAFVNKPAGMLSQRADEKDPSLVEYFTGYLLKSGALKPSELSTFHPGVCNRLDRNTSGMVVCGKSLKGLQEMSALFHDRTLHKDYLCIVSGVLKEKQKVRGFLVKDEASNKVEILSKKCEGALPIETWYTPLGNNGRMTLLMVRLITGRSHQIRAHLASLSHPILGDVKYDVQKKGRETAAKYRLRFQLLHAFRLTFPDSGNIPENLRGKHFEAPVPQAFRAVLEGEELLRFLPEGGIR